jgi:transcriptional regulator with XRE-family HTH domain
MVSGAALREAREHLGELQRVIADRVGMDQPRLSHMEARRTTRVDRALARDLAKALRVPVSAIVAEANDTAA